VGCADYRIDCDGDSDSDSDSDGNDLLYGVLDEKSVLESDFPERFDNAFVFLYLLILRRVRLRGLPSSQPEGRANTAGSLQPLAAPQRGRAALMESQLVQIPVAWRGYVGDTYYIIYSIHHP